MQTHSGMQPTCLCPAVPWPIHACMQAQAELAVTGGYLVEQAQGRLVATFTQPVHALRCVAPALALVVSRHQACMEAARIPVAGLTIIPQASCNHS